MIRFNCWFRWHFLGFHQISLTFFGLSLIFIGIFGALTFFGLFQNFSDLFGIRLRCLDSNQLMSQAVSRRLKSIELMIQAAFQELTQNQLMTRVDSPGIDSYWHMTQSASPFLDSDQLMTQAKSVWFWVDSWFDAESYPWMLVWIFLCPFRRCYLTLPKPP